MDAIPYTGYKNTLIRWIIALTVIAGFFTGYSGNATSSLKSKTQTEWVAHDQPLKKVRCASETGTKVPSVRDTFSVENEFFMLCIQNRLSYLSYAVNQKLVHSIILQVTFSRFKHRSQPSEEDSISV